MPIQTTVQLKGVLGGKRQTCLFIQDTGPDVIFRGRTARELFLQSVPNSECRNIRDEDVQVHIEVQRKCSFGIAGFTENSVQDAIRKARELESKSDEDLFEEGAPDPEALFISAVKALLERDEKTAFALADTFEFFANTTLGPEMGRGSGKQFIKAAAIVAAEIAEKAG